MSYQASLEDGVRNAGRLIKEGGAHAVKVEGLQPDLIHRLTEIGIPAMAHIGLTPQSVYGLGGYKVQGRGEAAQKVLDQAHQLEKAGAFAIVLEATPVELATDITGGLQIPTIGIGAGPGTDAQVLVINDLLGLTEKPPKLAKAYTDLRGHDHPTRWSHSCPTSKRGRSPTRTTATPRLRPWTSGCEGSPGPPGCASSRS